MGNLKYKRKHKESGLCLFCSLPAEVGEYCFKHRETHKKAHRIFNKKKRQEYLESGICTRCGNLLHEEMDAEHTKCLSCRENVPHLTKTYRRRYADTES